MKHMLSVVTVFLYFSIQAQDPALLWAKNMGGSGGDAGQSVAVDALGNAYTTGFFIGNASFNVGSDADHLNSEGIATFIAKSDATGNLVWARKIGGAITTDLAFGKSIALDAVGNIYITGYFQGTVDFDPGDGIDNVTSAGDYDIFISKLDPQGNLLWAKTVGGVGNDQSSSISFSASGNVYTTGYFNGTVDFDPGAGTHSLSSAGSADVFVLSLSASGDFLWANAVSSTDYDASNAIAADATGNVFFTGLFSATADFDPGAGTAQLDPANGHIFLSKWDNTGNFVWAKNFGGALGDVGQWLALDSSGNVYVTGNFSGLADFDPAAAEYNIAAASELDMFIAKFDGSGSLTWAKNIGGITPGIVIQLRSLAVDASGDTYTTGTILGGTVDFDPGAAHYDISDANGDMFINKLDASGNFVWAKVMGVSATSGDFPLAIAVDAAKALYITGSFSGTEDLDPGESVNNLTSEGESDIFVIKLYQAGPLPLTFTGIKAYQHNSGINVEWFCGQENNISGYDVERSQNGQYFTLLGHVTSKGSYSAGANYSFFDANPFNAINFYRIRAIEANRALYSQIVKVNIATAGSNIISIYPNPVEGNIVLQMTLRPGTYTATLCNKVGQMIVSKIIQHAGGSATQTIQLRKPLAAGMYLLTLRGSGTNISRPVIKK